MGGGVVSEIAVLITSIVGALSATGAAIAWLWNKIEKRFEKVENALDECREREARSAEREGKHLTVIELLWQEVERKTRGPNAVLDRAKRILDDLKGDD